MELTFNDMRNGYVSLCHSVLDSGDRVEVRPGVWTRETLNATFTLTNPYDALPVGVNRKLNKNIAYAEAAQLCGGFSSPTLMINVQPRFETFLDDGELYGAYGPRIVAQMTKIERILREEPNSRQAVAAIWNNVKDPYLRSGALARDVPCTVAIQFLYRNGKLHGRFVMRSNDCFWGVAYDVYQFATLTIALAETIGCAPGPVTVQAGSLHVYERDEEAISNLTYTKEGRPPYERLITPGASWYETSGNAYDMYYNNEFVTENDLQKQFRTLR